MKYQKKVYLQFFAVMFALALIILTISLVSKLTSYQTIKKDSKTKQESAKKIEYGPDRELRAVWMSRFDYTKNLQTTSPEKIKNYISTTFQKMAEANFNAVFFQIRGNADAYYQSKYEPWGKLLTGQLGQNPGWDPLEYALQEAHKNGLELHAWINVFPAWRGSRKPQPSKPTHPYLKNSDWLVHDSSGKAMELNSHYVSFSPGNPDVQNYIIKIIEDVITKYKVDGIHFDYIRYPEGGNYSYDPVSLKRFESKQHNPLQLDWEDWQREQVTNFVARSYNLITSKQPSIIMSAAVIGSYKGRRWNGYSRVYQDAKRWLELGKIDMIVPMTYVGRKPDSSGFRSFLGEWSDSRGKNRKIVAGIGVYKISRPEVLKEIDDIRQMGLDGCCLFSAGSLSDTLFQELKETKFHYPAKRPAMEWKSQVAPEAPHNLQIRKTVDHLILQWEHSKNKTTSRNYVIYASADSALDSSDVSKIIDIIPGKSQEYIIDQKKTSDRNYFITTLNAAGQESSICRFPR